MEQIPQAYDIVKEKTNSFTKTPSVNLIVTCMEEFTKLHVREALKAAARIAVQEHYMCVNDTDRIYDNYQILSAYPLDNIK